MGGGSLQRYAARSAVLGPEPGLYTLSFALFLAS